MPEPGNSEVHRKIPRRSFFATSLKALLVTGVGVKIAQEVNHEQQLAQTGEFETATAIWRPVYEVHAQHVEAVNKANLTGLLGLSFETNMSLQVAVSSLLTANGAGLDTIPPSIHPLFSSEMLSKFKASQIPLLFGDIQIAQTDAHLHTAQRLRVTFGTLMAIAGTYLGVTSSKIQKNELFRSRRSFLFKSGAAAMSAAIAMILPPSLRVDVMKKNMDTFQKHAAEQRLWARINTLTTNLTPEEIYGLFREILQANKLLIYADQLKQFGISEKPKIGFNWHVSHRGIEDWLRVDRALLRALILAYPDEILRSLIKENGNDARCLYGLRVVRVPKSLRETVNQKGERIGIVDPKDSISDIIFEDQELRQALIDRGLEQDKGYSKVIASQSS